MMRLNRANCSSTCFARRKRSVLRSRGGGDYMFDQQLKKPGYLEGVELDPTVMRAAFPTPDLNGVPLYDLASNPPQWFGTAFTSFGIIYNRDVDRYLGLPDPQTWSDLA